MLQAAYALEDTDFSRQEIIHTSCQVQIMVDALSWMDSEPQIIYSLCVCVCACMHVHVHLHMHARHCVTLQQGQARLRGIETPEVLVMWQNSWNSKRWRTKKGPRMEKKVSSYYSRPLSASLSAAVMLLDFKSQKVHCEIQLIISAMWYLIFSSTLGIVPKSLSIFLTLQTVLKLMMLSTDGDEGENSAGKKKRKKKKKKGCKLFFFP